ncbi:hypothetical protein FB45DRAFT_394033 [Roridomyces roridus]|uniref:Uncharacterized protein n=1 Tax=Roridomyces roridus TaxID=1738132 RepID=A0AAD7B2B9_9AGAR|nr:hypothetical protein FB45DRAFT_394033 [Roridomyces roridus]
MHPSSWHHRTTNNFKALNREGRAICRIVYAHDWTVMRIARIFGIPPKRVTKAIHNVYAPPDVVSEDYERVRDPEFARYFPPVESKSESRPESPLTAMDDSDDSDYSEEGTRVRTVKKPSRNKYTPVGHNASALHSFLENILHVDFSQHHALLVERGFTMPRLKIIASWPESAIKEALQRTLLIECEFTSDAAIGMTPFEVITLEWIAWAQGAWHVYPRTSSPLLCLVSFRSEINVKQPPNTNTSTTLVSFLLTIMGFDLTAHHSLLDTQGFDVQRLTLMGAWEVEDLRETLRRTLYRDFVPGGMSALEVLALEFVVRDCEWRGS